MRPCVSAGSNHVGASEMWTPHVICPSGAAAAGAATASTASRLQVTTRTRDIDGSPQGRRGIISCVWASLSPAAGEAQQHQEEVDEVQIERQRADDCVGADLS